MTTGLEVRTNIKTLGCNAVPRRQIAHQIDMSEGLGSLPSGPMADSAVDGRRQRQRAAEFHEVIEVWRNSRDDDDRAVSLADPHVWLVSEHDYADSLRSVQRYYRAHYPPPPKRARSWVETPPVLRPRWTG